MDFPTLHAQLRRCTRCANAGYAIQGPPIFSGAATARLMLVGQAPGKVEVNETFKPFSGSAGARLFRWLSEAGWSESEFRSSCYITAITKCFPGANQSGRGDRAPSKTEQALCADWLQAEIALVDPAVIVPVGSLAIARFLGPGRKLADVIGIRFEIDGRTIIPLPHPSGASAWTNKPAHQALIRQALKLLADAKRDFSL